MEGRLGITGNPPVRQSIHPTVIVTAKTAQPSTELPCRHCSVPCLEAFAHEVGPAAARRPDIALVTRFRPPGRRVSLRSALHHTSWLFAGPLRAASPSGFRQNYPGGARQHAAAPAVRCPHLAHALAPRSSQPPQGARTGRHRVVACWEIQMQAWTTGLPSSRARGNRAAAARAASLASAAICRRCSRCRPATLGCRTRCRAAGAQRGQRQGGWAPTVQRGCRRPQQRAVRRDRRVTRLLLLNGPLPSPSHLFCVLQAWTRRPAGCRRQPGRVGRAAAARRGRRPGAHLAAADGLGAGAWRPGGRARPAAAVCWCER